MLAKNDQDLLDVIRSLQVSLARCIAWRYAPDYVEAIAATALDDSDDALCLYDDNDDYDREPD